MEAIKLKFKDEDEFPPQGVSVIINTKSNGYEVTISDNEGEESHVFKYGRDNVELLELIKETLGL